MTRWAPERHCQITRMDSNGIQANSIMGYDKSTQQITELAFYTTGDYFLFKYRVVSPGVWKGEGVGIDHGKPFTEKLELRKLGRDSLEWKATDFVLGGEKQPDLVAVARRVKQNAAAVGVPEKALEALEYFVGSWTSETYVNNEKIGGGVDSRRWAPGKQCILMTGSGEEDGQAIADSGISGWDAHGNQLVERWYTTAGLTATVRYPLEKMSQDTLPGNFTVTNPDGTTFEGTCVLKKTEAGFTWTARWQENGEDMVRKGVARRVSPN